MEGFDDYPTWQEWLEEEWLSVEEVIPHPDWNDWSDFPYTYDVGVIILTEPYYPPNNKYGVLPPTRFLDNLIGQDRRWQAQDPWSTHPVRDFIG